MHPLTGYSDRWSVKPGGTIRFMVGSRGNAPFRLRFVRILCADPNPNGPGYSERAMPTSLDGEHPGRAQTAHPGSYGIVPALDIDLTPSATLVATIWPTTPEKGRQGVLSLSGGGWRLVLGIGAGGGAMLEAVAPDGRTVRAEVAAKLHPRRWYDLFGTIDDQGRLRVTQRPYQPLGEAGEAIAEGAPLTLRREMQVFLAAMPPRPEAPPGTADAYFNGKLERPTIWRGGHEQRRRSDPPPHPDTPGLLAAWDFSKEIGTAIARDVGPVGAHATLLNQPTRAMTGVSWTGVAHDWKVAPEQYGAIHFHDDDIGDLGWSESVRLNVPDSWPTGFYAAHLKNDAGEDYIPFFIRPIRPSAAVVLLVPTFTYQVYGCYARIGRGAEIAARSAEWGGLTETPDMNPEFGLSTYNHHSDGSGVSIATMLRPMLDTRPRQISLMDPVPEGSGTGRIVADSYIDQWLHTIGQEHDILTDHDLHEEGIAALAGYRVVITGQHPEYHSERMMRSFEEYVATGGRLMYLGGNGFYWRAEPSPVAPDAIEVRRAEGGIRVWATDPGESYHAFGGGYGGLWRRIGHPSHRLVGIGFSTQGRHLGFPYRFTSGIRDPRVAFMLDGLRPEPGATFGDGGCMGGGAAGFELDSVNPVYGTPPHALVVAKGVVIHPDYAPVNEDMLTHRHPLKPADWSCADMTFFETAAGGAVFSVGSMTYAGTLPLNAGRSVLGRLTANVVNRFVDPTPFSLPPTS